ncbi:hypothetical protein B484DRAFT_429696 [Ochromonadaceae sp. CCMP2298]|nr:hypothetical protein B484DRAFT_429696 [Ochromonadaceae sp. CCMP2298]|mmetsp:Transcript_30067/g.66546  ORF Transcript_30067/g.66546 Transcript_30067/m.66546 type:complete len:287 (-) Transcript_30067:211-1071(-)|eukprot:CAMPEP_0173180940 /NCGR_PEP_ID=MMETSP1141-20130122/7003_1 /TAXON_ID=483371 /ORGANISM="non described non described, Strain CCMP2298" /LENGTH=286 /DNA_ID=CAMNT_0014103863 /DNA_START=176 /DNA_END=1036 /DNA_ORIENTATION=+
MQTRSSPSLHMLHRLAMQVSIPEYDRLSKDVLFTKLKEKNDIDRLLRTEARQNRLETLRNQKKRDWGDVEDESQRQSASSSSSSSSSAPAPAKRAKLNSIDPIMLIPIGNKKCFKFVRPNGTVIRFNIESLVDYLLSSGDFSDPETRIPFTEADLREIDAIAKKSGLKKGSVAEAKTNIHSYSDAKFHRDALLALERCAGEVVTDILQIVETYDPDEAQMQLMMREFPAFLDYFRQLREADQAYASKCCSHWRLFMQGPPNKPNRDDYGLIHVVCHFFKSCDEGNL